MISEGSWLFWALSRSYSPFILIVTHWFIYFCHSFDELKIKRNNDLGQASAWTFLIATKWATIYNALLCNLIELKIEKRLKKNQNVFPRNRSTTSQILTICRILEDERAKNLNAIIQVFVDFFNVFDFIQRRNMEQILLTYGQPKETVSAILVLYKNIKVKVHSPRCCAARRHINPIPVYHLLRLRA